MPVLGGAQKRLIDSINLMADGLLVARLPEGTPVVPVAQYLDAVGNGSLDAAWVTPALWVGRNPAFGLFGAVPFGGNAVEHAAWLKYGSGERLMKDAFARFNVEALACGLNSPESGGWFTRALQSPDDLKGMPVHATGFGALVFKRLGAEPRELPEAEVAQALETGTIAGAQISMPIVDQSMGLAKAARHFYLPGWHRETLLNVLLVSKKRWDALTPAQRGLIQIACDARMLDQYVEGESVQPEALAAFAAAGVQQHAWSPEFLEAFEKAWMDVAQQKAEESPEFKRAWDSWRKFQERIGPWRNRGHLR